MVDAGFLIIAFLVGGFGVGDFLPVFNAVKFIMLFVLLLCDFYKNTG